MNVEASVVIDGKSRSEELLEALLVALLQTNDIGVAVSEFGQDLISSIHPQQCPLGSMAVQGKGTGFFTKDVVAEYTNAVVFGD